MVGTNTTRHADVFQRGYDATTHDCNTEKGYKKILFDAKTESDLPPRAAVTEEEKSAERKDLEIHLGVLRQGRDRYSHIDQNKSRIFVFHNSSGHNRRMVEEEQRQEGSLVGRRLAACMCMLSKTVICNGQRNMVAVRDQNIIR